MFTTTNTGAHRLRLLVSMMSIAALVACGAGGGGGGSGSSSSGSNNTTSNTPPDGSNGETPIDETPTGNSTGNNTNTTPTTITVPPPSTTVADTFNASGLAITGDPQSQNGARWTYNSTDGGVRYVLQGTLFAPRLPTHVRLPKVLKNGVLVDYQFPGLIVHHDTGEGAAAFTTTPVDFTSNVVKFGVESGIGQEAVKWGVVVIATNYTFAPASAYSNMPSGFSTGSPSDPVTDANNVTTDADMLRARKTLQILQNLNRTVTGISFDVDPTRIATHGHGRGADLNVDFFNAHATQLVAATQTGGSRTSANSKYVSFSTPAYPGYSSASAATLQQYAGHDLGIFKRIQDTYIDKGLFEGLQSFNPANLQVTTVSSHPLNTSTKVDYSVSPPAATTIPATKMVGANWTYNSIDKDGIYSISGAFYRPEASPTPPATKYPVVILAHGQGQYAKVSTSTSSNNWLTRKCNEMRSWGGGMVCIGVNATFGSTSTDTERRVADGSTTGALRSGPFLEGYPGESQYIGTVVATDGSSSRLTLRDAAGNQRYNVVPDGSGDQTLSNDSRDFEDNTRRMSKVFVILEETSKGLGNYADTTRMAVDGHSRGAFLVPVFAARYGDKLKAASMTAGGLTDEFPRLLYAPLINSTGVRFSIHHGQSDTAVNISFGRNLFSSLNTFASVTGTHQMYEYPGLGHSSSDPTMYQRVKNWYACRGVLTNVSCDGSYP